MYQTREQSGHDPFKPFKGFMFSFNGSDAFKSLFRSCAFVLFIISVSVILYSVFTRESTLSRCPECPNLDQDISEQTCDPSDSEPTNIHHIVFGLAGSVRTWNHRRKYSELWWEPNITRGFVWLDEKPGPNTTWPENSIPYRVSSDWTRFKYTSSQSAVRIARILVDSFRVGLPDARWFVMGDDDTVFFTHNLVTVLSKYDHRRMYYIGGNSESVEQDVMHDYDMAFGGGGFAISYPLAAELVRVMDGCLERYYNFYGSDQRVGACVKELGVPLTREFGFHQIDVRGDLFGLLSAHPLAPIVSLHHLDYVEPLFPNQTQHQSLTNLVKPYRLDPSRLLQQCFCFHRRYKWSVSVSWGYSVMIHPSLLPAVELVKPLQTFKTWRSFHDGPFVFNTRPVSLDPCERPAVFHLDSVKEDIRRGMVTTYNSSMNAMGKECRKRHYARVSAVKRVVVTALKMDPAEWKTNPRRQCCEVKNSKNGVLKVKIRRCNRWESITP